MNGESTAPCGGFDPVKKEWQKYVVIDKVWGDRLLLMPIPTSAMDVNPLLKDDQNPGYSKPLFILLNDNEWKYMDSKKITSTRGGRSFIGVFIMCSCINRFIYYLFIKQLS